MKLRMQTVELFSGTKSFSKVAMLSNHNTFTIDNNPDIKPDLCKDVMELRLGMFPQEVDIMWCSPPCTAFSVASIGRHWNKNNDIYIPKSDSAREGIKILNKTISLISQVKPKYWFIENPRGMMRKVIDDVFKKHKIGYYKRVTISYCQYGDSRMKPTDIWTNCYKWYPRPMCSNGDSCHVSAPRGSRTGTQGLKDAKERGVVPAELFYDIFTAITKINLNQKEYKQRRVSDYGGGRI